MCKLLIVVLFVVVGLAAYLALRPTEAEQYERLRHAQAMHAVAEARAEALAPFEVAAVGGGAVVLVLLLAGTGTYAVANLRKSGRYWSTPIVTASSCWCVYTLAAK